MKRSKLNPISKKRLATGKATFIKRTPIKKRITPTVSKKTAEIVIERSENRCEFAENCSSTILAFAHIKHRQMGGRHGKMKDIYDDSRNVARSCQCHHDIWDNRVYLPNIRVEIGKTVKQKTGWDSWALENNIREREL